MPQKAYCRDYDRLHNSVSDLGTAIRTIPNPTDGTSDDPPSVEPGDFTLEQDPVPLPGMERFGIARVSDGEPNTYVIRGAGFGGDDPDAEGAVAVLYGFLMPDAEHFVKDSLLLPNSITYGIWDLAGAEIDRLRAGIFAFRLWADGVGSGADNSATREAMAECVRRLDTLESAMAETVKKWREH